MNEETDFSAFIKNRITELRCQKGISEYTLSLAIGRSQGYIQSISSGKILPSKSKKRKTLFPMENSKPNL